MDKIQYREVTMKTFVEILADRIEKDRVNIAALARSSGVTKDQLYKLAKRKNASTSVDAAIKIAAFFGETLDEFMGQDRTPEEREILSLVSQLPDDLRRQLLGYGQGLLAPKDQSPPESGEDTQ